MSDNTTTGLRRLKSIIKPGGPIPVGKSTWYAGVKSGLYPAPVRLGPHSLIAAYAAESASFQNGEIGNYRVVLICPSDSDHKRRISNLINPRVT
jgi:hypothetical protein